MRSFSSCIWCATKTQNSQRLSSFGKRPATYEVKTEFAVECTPWRSRKRVVLDGCRFAVGSRIRIQGEITEITNCSMTVRTDVGVDVHIPLAESAIEPATVEVGDILIDWGHINERRPCVPLFLEVTFIKGDIVYVSDPNVGFVAMGNAIKLWGYRPQQEKV